MNEVFDAYAGELTGRLGRRGRGEVRVWCSWYSYYEDISEDAIARIVGDSAPYPFDVLQIDDGWEVGIGDWQPNADFPNGMESMAELITSSGREAGLWLAPLIAGADSRLAHDRPELLLRDTHGRPVVSGINWGGPYYSLDPTSDATAEFLTDLITTVRSWGFTYLKLDFLYAAGFPGDHARPMPRDLAYRHAAEVMRRAAGDDCYLLACGAPVIASTGVFDGCGSGRTSPNSGRTSASRRWVTHQEGAPAMRSQRRANGSGSESVFDADPDVVYLDRSEVDLDPRTLESLQDLARITGFIGTSDRLGDLSHEERERLVSLLTHEPRESPAGPTCNGRSTVVTSTSTGWQRELHRRPWGGALMIDRSTFAGPHRRYNPLADEWVLVSAQRTDRPWLGQVEKPTPDDRPRFDPQCYLCPGTERAGGVHNDDYTGTYVFTNDYPALIPNRGPRRGPSRRPVRRQGGGGHMQGRVFLASPRPGPRRDGSRIRSKRSSTSGQNQTEELGRDHRWVQVFENRGAAMGASNPHPHGQIWATSSIPTLVATEDAMQRAYRERSGSVLLLDYAAQESSVGDRVVVENDEWLIVVPYWAVWPFETLILPKREVTRITELDANQRTGLCFALKEILTRYDNLFGTAFPYSMGWHGAPFTDDDHRHWQLHAHIYPPLLRSATVRKFMVGYELLAESQRDLTAESAAARIREVSATHYRADGAGDES